MARQRLYGKNTSITSPAGKVDGLGFGGGSGGTGGGSVGGGSGSGSLIDAAALGGLLYLMRQKEQEQESAQQILGYTPFVGPVEEMSDSDKAGQSASSSYYGVNFQPDYGYATKPQPQEQQSAWSTLGDWWSNNAPGWLGGRGW